MAGPEIISPTLDDPQKQKMSSISWGEFPWWLVAIFSFLIVMGVLIIRDPEINQAFVFILPGIKVTILITLEGFGLALILGLLAGLGRINKNKIIRNIAITYVEFIRGVPTLVLILTLSYVIVPAITNSIGLGAAKSPPIFGLWPLWASSMVHFWLKFFVPGLNLFPKDKWKQLAHWV